MDLIGWFYKAEKSTAIKNNKPMTVQNWKENMNKWPFWLEEYWLPFWVSEFSDSAYCWFK